MVSNFCKNFSKIFIIFIKHFYFHRVIFCCIFITKRQILLFPRLPRFFLWTSSVSSSPGLRADLPVWRKLPLPNICLAAPLFITICVVDSAWSRVSETIQHKTTKKFIFSSSKNFCEQSSHFYSFHWGKLRVDQLYLFCKKKN